MTSEKKMAVIFQNIKQAVDALEKEFAAKEAECKRLIEMVDSLKKET